MTGRAFSTRIVQAVQDLHIEQGAEANGAIRCARVQLLTALRTPGKAPEPLPCRQLSTLH
jgi:hypothetical protein